MQQIKQVIEAALLAAPQALSSKQLAELFVESDEVDGDLLQAAIDALIEESQQRGVELKEVASGFRYQVRNEVQPWVSRLWTEKPPKYSRALLETLSLIAYRQPITRGEIEQIRGVAVSSHIIKTLEEREWIRVVGHRDVPGRPALFGTTRSFLDYFSLRSLDELPPLTELQELPDFEPELPLQPVAQSDAADADQATESSEPGLFESPDVEAESEQAEADHTDTEFEPAPSQEEHADPDIVAEATPADDDDSAPPSPSLSMDDPSPIESADAVLDSAPSSTDNDPSFPATEETSAQPHVEVKTV
nr:SMC-Scp complex subunit ScpB [Pseudomarimonas arenosa]